MGSNTTMASELQAAARDAYIWGYPLVVMHRTRALHCSRTPLGSLYHIENLSTSADRTVVAPNNDTLYSSGWFDLRHGDLLIEVPPIDRYWSVMVLDAYSHVSYVSRRTHGTQGAAVRLTLDPHTEPPRDGAEVLPAATPTIWILVRTVVEGPDDLARARAIQRSISVTAPAAHPRLTIERRGRPNLVHTSGAGFFTELAAAIGTDAPAPWHPQPSDAAQAMLKGWSAVHEDILAAGVQEGEALVAANLSALDGFGDGWGTNTAGSDFGADLLHRASTAKYGLATHHPAENRYYVARSGAAGAVLDGRRPLALRFEPGQPPCNGFWSLTVYGQDMFLIDNELGRYSIGNRSVGLEFENDGSLNLVVGGSRPARENNWLPAPEGPYLLGLRVYEGSPEVVDAAWYPPPPKPIEQP